MIILISDIPSEDVHVLACAALSVQIHLTLDHFTLAYESLNEYFQGQCAPLHVTSNLLHYLVVVAPGGGWGGGFSVS